jgi:precorrin-2/cobalt-factor-2 C20-methyltransferase
LYTLGIGPGDPELVTVKAARLIAASPVVAFFAKRGRAGNARGIAAAYMRADAEELRLEYPFTTEMPVDDPRYHAGIGAFYDEAAGTIATRLAAGQNIALLCEGDPFFYGSSMYLFDRLGGAYPTEVVPGVTGMSGCWTRAKLPMLHGDDVLSVIPGTLDDDAMRARLGACDAAVIMKLGRNFSRVRENLARAGLAERAIYVERGTMADERIAPLSAVGEAGAPYFSLVLVPGRQRRR